jgi:hypothetical protein
MLGASVIPVLVTPLTWAVPDEAGMMDTQMHDHAALRDERNDIVVLPVDI